MTDVLEVGKDVIYDVDGNVVDNEFFRNEFSDGWTDASLIKETETLEKEVE
mgnify:CR=1 FL=1